MKIFVNFDIFFFIELINLGPNKFDYNKVNEKIEKWTKITYIAFIKVTFPFMYLPKLFLSYYGFFIGQGSDAFVLNVPMS